MRIRVATYNIHKCIGGLDRRYDPTRIRDTLAHYEPDLVMLQEVDNGAERSNRDKQHDLLGDMLGMRYRTYFPNVTVRGGGVYGNAILSQYPLTDTSNIDLTIPLKKRRSALHARYRIRLRKSTRTLHVFNLHLGLSGFERKIQLRKFLDSHPFARLHPNTPILLAGDFNDVYATLGPKLLLPAGFRTYNKVIPTFPAYAPLRALDGIYVRGHLKIDRVFRPRLAVATQASDHIPLIADLRILPARG